MHGHVEPTDRLLPLGERIQRRLRHRALQRPRLRRRVPLDAVGEEDQTRTRPPRRLTAVHEGAQRVEHVFRALRRGEE